MSNANLIREYLLRHKGISKLGLAKILVEEHPHLFKNVESARVQVRYVTGTQGIKKIHKKEVNQSFYYNGFENWAKQNLNTEDRPWDDPFIIPDSIKTLNVIADLHSIHLDYKVMEKFISTTKDKTAVLINGDLMDSESLSRHLKGHSLIEYDRELEICHQILKGLKQEFNHVYFKAGNHDFWLERYLLNNAREIFRLRGLQIQELLQCAGIGVEYIHNLKYIQYGDLDIIHGHEFNSGFGAGKFPAGGFVDKWQTFKGRYDVKILASHCHRQDYVASRRSKDGKYGFGWVTPAMCRKAASYNPYAGWDNGWAVLTNDSGRVTVDIVKI